MEIAIVLFVLVLAAAPLVAATVLAHRMGRRGLWKVWPSVTAVLFGLATAGGSQVSGGGFGAAFPIFAGGYVGCLALLVALVIVRAAPRSADTVDVF